LKEPSHRDEGESHLDYLEILYKRHFQGALVRSGGSVIIWSFALVSFLTSVINIAEFKGITLSALYLILINPPTLLLLKRITDMHLYRYASLLVNFLEIVGYTAIIYFVGGIEAAHLSLLYAALITYVGAMAPWRFPYVIAIMCSAALSFVVTGEYFRFLPRYSIYQSFDLPWATKWAILLMVIGLLFFVAYISSLTAATLRKNRNKLSEQNLELIEKTRILEEAQNELRAAHQELEARVEIRTLELARANDALRESEGKYRNILESIDEAYFELDLKGNMTFWNDSTLRIGGYARSELMNMNYRQYASPETAKMLRDVFSNIYKTGKKESLYDFALITKDKSTRNMELSVNLMRNSAGEAVGFRCIARDMTERKRAEEALHQSEEKYRAIIENMEEGYIEVDLNGRLTFFNEAALNFLGYSREETMGMHYKKYVDEENVQKIFEAYSGVYKTGVPLPFFEWEIIRKDGSRRTVEGSASLIADAGGQPVGFRGLFRDTTDRKRLQDEREHLQERLYRAEKMEALGTLAGGVAHDLNNVLGAVVGYSELLLMEIPEGNPGRRRISTILNSSLKASAIIQDLLTLARRGVAISEVVNLNEVIADYLETPEFEKLKAHHPHVSIKVDLEKELLNIKGSPVHLGKTIMNLVSNASEAISDEGEVMIRTENHYIRNPVHGYDDVQGGDYVVLTVSDNGRGISASDIKKIFEPFYTKKVMGRSGTGLGLAVVWGTVKDHDGYIDVQSEDGKGSTFTIYLPATREELSGDEQKTSPEHYMGRGETVLVVDDVKEQREVATSILTRLGYRVEAVSGGEEATGYLKTSKADLIVLDMIMDPGIDGLETYQRVLAINPKQKAIIVSGFSETDRVHTAQSLGAGAYIRKPYVMESLGLAVRNELDRK
jgi:PAS domain S-box-containing protein